MAEIKNLEFSVAHNDGSSTLTAFVEYDIEFGSLDTIGNVSYRETCRVIGDDTDVGDVATGGDDVVIPPAQLVDQTMAANGGSAVHRSLTRDFSRTAANEDTSRIRPKDELRVEVRMVDTSGQLKDVFAESKLVEARF